MGNTPIPSYHLVFLTFKISFITIVILNSDNPPSLSVNLCITLVLGDMFVQWVSFKQSTLLLHYNFSVWVFAKEPKNSTYLNLSIVLVYTLTSEWYQGAERQWKCAKFLRHGMPITFQGHSKDRLSDTCSSSKSSLSGDHHTKWRLKNIMVQFTHISYKSKIEFACMFCFSSIKTL